MGDTLVNELVKKQLQMFRGDTFAFDVNISELDSPDGVASMFFTIKKKATEIQNTVQKSLDDGITKIDDSTYHCRVAPEDTKDVPAGKYVYDLQLGIGEDIYTVMYGTIDILQDVTT